MTTGLEIRIEHEDLIKAEAKKRFPSLDPDWAVKRWLDIMYDNSKKTAEVIVAMMPEVMRATRRTNGSTKA